MRSNFLGALALLLLTSCALFEERKGPSADFAPREQVFYASFDEVWRACNLVLQPYPLRVSNMDQGILETDIVRGFKVWNPPFKPEAASGGQMYKMTIKIIRGKFSGRTATKVAILKEQSLQKDFFTDPKPQPTDGLEEKSILYRIGREVLIERSIARSQKKHNSKPQKSE